MSLSHVLVHNRKNSDELLVLLTKYYSDINFKIVLFNYIRVGSFFSFTKISFLSQCACLLFILFVVHFHFVTMNLTILTGTFRILEIRRLLLWALNSEILSFISQFTFLLNCRNRNKSPRYLSNNQSIDWFIWVDCLIIIFLTIAMFPSSFQLQPNVRRDMDDKNGQATSLSPPLN